MIWFLRLFSAYRHACLERDYFRTAAERDSDWARRQEQRHDDSVLRWSQRLERAEADVASWKEKAEHWEAEYKKANADAIKARETVADFISQMRFGRKIFEHAPAMPEKAPNQQPLPKMRQQARIRVQQNEAQFAKDLQAYVSHRVDGNAPQPARAETAPVSTN